MLNGKKPILNNTKHINVRYFFVKDVINRGEISVEYFTTKKMCSYMLTKLFQGKSYPIMRSKLMDMPELYVELGENAPAKVSKAVGMSANKK